MLLNSLTNVTLISEELLNVVFMTVIRQKKGKKDRKIAGN